MKSASLEEVIRYHIALPTHPASTGWYPILCKVCSDHGKKGPRAAFKFDDNGVSYHCFNCKAKAVYKATDQTISPNMTRILTAFGIPREELQEVQLAALKQQDSKHSTSQPLKLKDKSLDLIEIPLPSDFYRVDPKSDDIWTQIATEYLDLRGITADQYPFYLSKSSKWKGRLIIPIYRDNKLIFFQGRDMTEAKKNKYKSADVPKDNIVYGFDRVYSDSEQPLYIVEGFFDAFVIDGVATLGNEFSQQQLRHLQRSRRPKVIIPDRRGDGGILAKQALKQGWMVSFPEIGSCKDVNEAVVKYGKLYVIKSITENIVMGPLAEIAVGVHCEQSKNNKDPSSQKNKKAPKANRGSR